MNQEIQNLRSESGARRRKIQAAAGASRFQLSGFRFPISAFSLVEVTIAIGIAGFCLLALFGLLPIGLKTNQAAIQQTLGNSILSSVAADLRNTPVTSPRGVATNTPQFGITVPANLQGASNTLYFTGEGQATNQASARFRLTVTFSTNGPGARSASLANVKITWPPSVATNNASGSVETFIALDRN